MGPAGTTEAAGTTAPGTVIVRRKLIDSRMRRTVSPAASSDAVRSHAVALATDAYPPFRLGP